VISSGDLYCCLLPRCEALCTCRSGFPIATRRLKWLSPPCPQKLYSSIPSWLLSIIYRCTAKTSIHLSVKSELKTVRCRMTTTKALSVRIHHRKERPIAL